MNGKRLSYSSARSLLLLSALALATLATASKSAAASQETDSAGEQIGIRRGICAVLGLPVGDRARVIKRAAARGDLVVYFQSPSAEDVSAVRQAAEAAGPTQ